MIVLSPLTPIRVPKPESSLYRVLEGRWFSSRKGRSSLIHSPRIQQLRRGSTWLMIGWRHDVFTYETWRNGRTSTHWMMKVLCIFVLRFRQMFEWLLLCKRFLHASCLRSLSFPKRVHWRGFLSSKALKRKIALSRHVISITVGHSKLNGLRRGDSMQLIMMLKLCRTVKGKRKNQCSSWIWP